METKRQENKEGVKHTQRENPQSEHKGMMGKNAAFDFQKQQAESNQEIKLENKCDIPATCCTMH